MVRSVILCGGSGTRLWPLSRELSPKQFMELSPGRTLFTDTLKRIQACEGADPIVICNKSLRFSAAEQMRKNNITGRIILEPVGRNTAPAIAVAALSAASEDEILYVMPSDHVLEVNDAFKASLDKAGKAAADGSLVCFGIVPQSAHTGYGYIRRGDDEVSGVYAVREFVEKPGREKAEEYVASGDYLWNSGMFVFRAGTYLETLEKYSPEMVAACRQAWDKAQEDLDFIRLDEAAFSECPAESIDYAVMEKAENIRVVPLESSWSDLGSWGAMHEIGEKDGNGNACLGDVLSVESKDCYIHSSDRLVATVGIENLVVVETSDAVLVADRDKLQAVKDVVARLKRDERIEAESHPVVHRPWGSYQSVDMGERFQVKRIVVKPGELLSLQKHYHRAEHWIVVRGTARVVNGDREILLEEDQSTYIPLGHMHRLENPGTIPLELIEVQTGSYLGEDDIVRFEDKYSREQG